MTDGFHMFSTNNVFTVSNSIETRPGWLKLDPRLSLKLSPPLGCRKRGGLILVELAIGPEDKGFSVDSIMGVDPNLIRTAMLFSDELDFPDNANFALCPLEELLLDGSGTGVSSKVKWTGQTSYQDMTTYGWLAFQALEQREPGQWSIWQSPSQSVIPESELTPDLAFQLEFRNSLLVPSAETPYQDIVRFRENHHDELIALHQHITEMAVKLSKEGDVRAITVERERFDSSLSDYLKKARQSNISKVLTTIKAEFDLSTFIRQALMGGGGGGILSLAGDFSLEKGAAAMGAGILTSLSIKSAAGLTKTDTSAFRYIAQAERQFN